MRRVVAFLLALVMAGAACSSGETSDTGSTAPASTTSMPRSTTIPLPPTTTTSKATTAFTSTTTTTTATVPPDVTPPDLAVTDPAPGATVATRTYTFRGTTESGCTVSAWDQWEADVDAAGNWSISLVLNLGSNVAWFRAMDAAGNNTVTDLTVDYAPPAMPCEPDADTGQEHCGGFGDILEVDLDRSEIIFDLYRFVSTGTTDSADFEFVNENPLLRTLRVADDVEIRACTPEPDSRVPAHSCGSFDDFAYWTLSELADFVAAGAIWWGVTTRNSIVVHIDQWWSP